VSKGGFQVVRPGYHTLLQDGGRRGHFRLGLSVGGPMDRLSFLWANRLCGNRSDATALEITLGNLELRATAPIQIAVTGPGATLSIDGALADTWRSHNISPGTTLYIAAAAQGVRHYLAVRGGFQITPMFSSTSTITREGIGGLNGAALSAGDFLPFVPCSDEREFLLPLEKRPILDENTPLRVLPGWQRRELPRELKRAFFNSVFRVSANANRMGFRVEGVPLPGIEAISTNMVSEGIVSGAIQLTPDGLPIIMLCDHQTIGGYPKIGTLITPDCWRLAQLQAGSAIRFAPVTAHGAQMIYRKVMRHYEATCPSPVHPSSQRTLK